MTVSCFGILVLLPFHHGPRFFASLDVNEFLSLAHSHADVMQLFSQPQIFRQPTSLCQLLNGTLNLEANLHQPLQPSQHQHKSHIINIRSDLITNPKLTTATIYKEERIESSAEEREDDLC